MENTPATSSASRPLLASAGSRNASITSDDGLTSRSTRTSGFLLSHAAVCCLVLNFALELFNMGLITPQVALFQRSICFRFYQQHDSHSVHPNGSTDQQSCKILPIQHELAVFRGWKGVFDSIPGIHQLEAAFQSSSFGTVYSSQMA